MILPNCKGWPEAFTIRGKVPKKTLLKYTGNLAYIYFLEAWAQIVAAITASDLLGQRYVTFCDNEAAKHALTKEYGKDPAVNAAIGAYWCFLTATATEAWMERVSSPANLSDEVSRNKFDLASKHGWIHVTMDYTEAYNIMEMAATDMQFAHEAAPQKLYNCLAGQFRKALEELGYQLPRLYSIYDIPGSRGGPTA